MKDTNPISSQVEDLAPGATFERTHNGQIFVFMLSDITRVSIDAWIAKIKDLTGGWTNERPFLALTQVSGKYMTLTPYLRARMEELSHWNPNLWAYTAVVLPKSFFVQLMASFVPTLHLRNTQARLFHTHEEALGWLEKALAETQGKRL
jgi:hypothetical protein